MNNVTAIIVSYNTPELLSACYESIRRFYPNLDVILIDGSEYGIPCWNVCHSIKSTDYKTRVEMIGHNIGHGYGMAIGIEMCNTDYFLLVDSDVTLNRGGVIEKIWEIFNSHTFDYGKEIYGVGQVVQTDSQGNNADAGIDYLHPHFALIKKSMYEKFDPIINHGAPMIRSMLHIAISGAACVVDFPVSHFVTHHERGTRNLNPKEFNPGNWDKV